MSERAAKDWYPTVPMSEAQWQARVYALEAALAEAQRERAGLAQDLTWAAEVLRAAAPSRDENEGHYANRALVYVERALAVVRVPPAPEKRECGFCHGGPVGNAATWLDGKPRPPAPCPRCGETFDAAGAA